MLLEGDEGDDTFGRLQRESTTLPRRECTFLMVLGMGILVRASILPALGWTAAGGMVLRMTSGQLVPTAPALGSERG